MSDLNFYKRTKRQGHGTEITTKLEKRIRKSSQNVKRLLLKINGLMDYLGLPKLSQRDVFADGDNYAETILSDEGQLSGTLKMELLNLTDKISRSKEEIEYAKLSIDNATKFCEEQISFLGQICFEKTYSGLKTPAKYFISKRITFLRKTLENLDNLKRKHPKEF